MKKTMASNNNNNHNNHQNNFLKFQIYSQKIKYYYNKHNNNNKFHSKISQKGIIRMIKKIFLNSFEC